MSFERRQFLAPISKSNSVAGRRCIREAGIVIGQHRKERTSGAQFMGRVVSYMKFKQGRELRLAILTNAKQTTEFDPLEMGSVVFRCPLTGQEFDSGIDMDRQTFTIIAHTKIAIRCKCCQQPYQWAVGSGNLVHFASSREREDEALIRALPSLRNKVLPPIVPLAHSQKKGRRALRCTRTSTKR